MHAPDVFLSFILLWHCKRIPLQLQDLAQHTIIQQTTHRNHIYSVYHNKQKTWSANSGQPRCAISSTSMYKIKSGILPSSLLIQKQYHLRTVLSLQWMLRYLRPQLQMQKSLLLLQHSLLQWMLSY